MSQTFNVKSIARVSCSRTEAFDDQWDDETSVIELDTSVLGASAATGISEFSHIEVLFIFDRVRDEKIVSDARRPRANPNWPEVGILAQRGKNRPNKIGATICQVISVAENNITVKGLDAIDGTPVIDIKPVMSGFLPRTTLVEPRWAKEIMKEYWRSK